MQACPRRDCGGAVGATWGGQCTLCGRGEIAARPPTAREAGDKRLEKPNLTDYFSGIYAIGYIPTIAELAMAEG